MFPRPTAAPIIANMNAIDESHSVFSAIISSMYNILKLHIIILVEKMNVFDKFMMGETSSINWCFENRHFQERLRENGLSQSYVVDCLMMEEPISWQHVEGDLYAVVYDAPPSKDYREIRILLACRGNSIDLVTIMRNNETTTNRQKRQYQSDKQKSIEKKRLKALSKRRY